MNNPKLTGLRGPQVLAILKSNGPLSFYGLSSLVTPPMTAPRLHETLGRLLKKKLIVKRHEKVYRGHGTFYQIPQELPKRRAVANILECEPDVLRQFQYRSRDLLHAELCALWRRELQKVFPDAIVLRDFEIRHSDLAKQAMIGVSNQRDMTPDIIMMFVKNSHAEPVRIAVEIERSQKATVRLHGRIQKYSKKTAFDGVIYICSEERLADLVSNLYRKYYMKNVDRISHYGRHFFLFMSSDRPSLSIDSQLLTGEKSAVRLGHWVSKLRSTSPNFRRDEQFVRQ